MAKFKIGDSIQLVNKLGRVTPVRKGTVISGPYVVDGVDHYNVNWHWDVDGTLGRNPNIISDLSSTKYEYRLSNEN